MSQHTLSNVNWDKTVMDQYCAPGQRFWWTMAPNSAGFKGALTGSPGSQLVKCGQKQAFTGWVAFPAILGTVEITILSYDSVTHSMIVTTEPTAGDPTMKMKLFKGTIVKTKRQLAAATGTDTVEVEYAVFAVTDPIVAADAAKARDVIVAEALKAEAITIADLTNQVEPIEIVVREF